jgi:hypothetical protein
MQAVWRRGVQNVGYVPAGPGVPRKINTAMRPQLIIFGQV